MFYYVMLAMTIAASSSAMHCSAVASAILLATPIREDEQAALALESTRSAYKIYAVVISAA